MSKRTLRLPLAVILLVGVGCGGNKTVDLSSTHLAAIEHNRRGIRAESAGDHARALAELTEALRIHRSVENTDGAAVVLVNRARVHRRRGELEPAQRDIDDALSLIVAPRSGLFAEAAFEKALCSLAAGDLPAAEEWASRAEAADPGPKTGGRKNLVARVLLARGDLAEARKKGEEALELTVREGQAEEEANARRLLGNILVRQGHRDEASRSYESALGLDKKLGKSEKIAADLRGLGRLAEAFDERSAALGYYRRACEVSRNGRDLPRAAEDLLEIARILGDLGDSEEARRVLAERDELLRSAREP